MCRGPAAAQQPGPGQEQRPGADRRHLGRRPPEPLSAATDQAAPASSGESGDLAEALAVALQRLPDKLRVPLLLKAWEGFSFAQIARRLEVPQGTVESRVARARERLRALWPG